MRHKIRVLFVCLGNICRSPMAEAMFRYKVEQKRLSSRLEIASAGTGAYHVGENADRRTLATLKAHGIDFTHRAQQAQAHHFQQYDYLIAMDRDNQADLKLLDNSAEAQDKLGLMLSHHREAGSLDVPDPYFGGEDGFEQVYQLLDKALDNFLDKIIVNHKLQASAEAPD